MDLAAFTKKGNLKWIAVGNYQSYLDLIQCLNEFSAHCQPFHTKTPHLRADVFIFCRLDYSFGWVFLHIYKCIPVAVTYEQ